MTTPAANSAFCIHNSTFEKGGRRSTTNQFLEMFGISGSLHVDL
jgi:hypothetical protein